VERSRLKKIPIITEPETVLGCELYCLTTFSSNQTRVWVIKVDENGEPIWHRTFSGMDIDWGSGN